jgi:peptidoglycan/LPS O-acetylase OafA/YrhL
MESPQKINTRIPELDALKGIAVLGVLLTHYTMESKELMAYGFRLGSVGVEFLFILAGFMAMMALEKAENGKDFLIRRVWRAYPAYWASVTLTTLFIGLLMAIEHRHVFQSHLYHDNLLIQFLANLTMLQQYLRVLDIDTDYWTLFVGLLFYGFMYVVYLLGRLRQIELVGTVLLLPVLVYALFAKEQLPFVHKILTYFFPLINHFPLFLAGIVFYKMKYEGATPQRYLLAAVALAIQPLLLDDGGWTWVFASEIDLALMLAAFYGIFILLIQNRLRWIVNPVTLFLGGISYPLYLVHQVIGALVIAPLLVKYAGLSHWVAMFCVSLPCVLVFSWLIHRYIEMKATPFRAALFTSQD